MSGAKDRLGMEVHALLLEDKAEWAQAIDDILGEYGEAGVREILRSLQDHVLSLNIPLDEATLNTPYRNTIGPESQPAYPGNLALEERIEKIIRWNAIAMVLQAQDKGIGVGGHIATYASCATLLEVGFNHFFRGAGANNNRGAVDMLLPQPHAAPGIYARAFLEGRLSETHLKNYRQELGEGGGLSSYPHPRSMPDFWEVPNASMGLSTPTAIYQARFAKYLENRGLKEAASGKVWCFIGDGESDEPEVLGTINIAAREKLDNLVLVVNCNLQRLDGPVRGNGKIIQELERVFRGADWQVLKVIWGSGWDALLSRDSEGVLQRRMDECLDGDYQMYSVLPGDVQREHWVEGNAALEQMMNTLTDEEVKAIKRGGQDQKKIFAAFAKASEPNGKPTVILVKTVKGDGMGAQGKNTAHQYKNIPVEERVTVAKELGIPLDDKAAMAAQFYRPAEDSPELIYMREQREKLDGYLPNRNVSCAPLQIPQLERFKEILAGSGKREVSTTMVMVRLMSSLLRMPEVAKYIVPIVPDEARTFGMDGLFKAAGIYSADGQKYRPVDADSLLPYREANDGQILQEGICEVGAMASFMAAGSAYSVHGLPMIPFYIFYSMFGFQRVGDMIWSCGDMMCKGFLLGGTAGRTTLNGEGLQHQDGHSHLMANMIPNCHSYDPTYSYELAVIIQDGMRRMYHEKENVFYYITTMNENYLHPDMPEGAEEGIIKGLYKLRASSVKKPKLKVQLMGSGTILREAEAAAELLKADFKVEADIWSATSINQLCREGNDCERWNMLHPEAEPKVPYVSELLNAQDAPVICATDYIKAYGEQLRPYIRNRYVVLGTDGYGRSDTRAKLRAHFEVDRHYIVVAALKALADEGKVAASDVSKAIAKYGIDADKINPIYR